MRLAFWRAGRGEAGVRESAATLAPIPTAEPAPSTQFGDIDLRGLGEALARKRRWIIVPTVLAPALGFVLGVCALMAGLVINAGTATIAVSVAGFLLMVVCCVWALTSWKRMAGIGNEPARRGRQARPAKAGFMERMEERWRRRTEGE